MICKICDEWFVKRGNEEVGSNIFLGGGLLCLCDLCVCKLKYE